MSFEKVRELFQAAYELPGEERARYLADACGTDVALRDEVDELLAAAAVETSGLRPDTNLLEVAAPELEGYAIEEELGRGGMGTVYRGRELATDRHVAIKVLHPWLLMSPRCMERFRREAEVGINVRHPNVVQTLAFGDAGSQRYLVMEYIEGRTLRGLLDELGRVPETLLREIARQAATGLQAIHGAGILHRDLKPENILISEDERVLLMDLGIAKVAEGSIDLTREGQFVGSLAYAAPEQFEGEQLRTHADLYALGVVLHELASGTNPFRFEEPLAAIRAHRELALDPLHVTEPHISAFFSAIVSQLTAKDPGDRLESAAELVEILLQGEEGEWWRRRARRDVAPALQTMRRTSDTPLVGRRTEWDGLHEAWDDLRRGIGRTVLLTGEAGSGKSRLVLDWAQRLTADEAHVLYGAYPPEGGRDGLIDALRDRFGARHADRALAPYLANDSLRAALATRIRGDIVPTGQGPDAVASALVHLLRGLSEDRPVVWIIDDLHFAKGEAKSAARALAHATRDSRALLIITSRSLEESAAGKAWSAETPMTSIALERLGRDAIRELLISEYRDDALADRLADEVWERSEGVPFFALQIMRALEEQGIVVRDPDGRARIAQHDSALTTPPAIREVVRGRVAELDARYRRILDAAAVYGLEFDADLVADIVQSPLIGVLQDLAEMERRLGVIRSHGRLFRFDHHVVQESLYEAVPPRLLEELHRGMADAILARSDGKPSRRDALLVVKHHLRGSEPAEALPHLDAALAYAEGRFEAGLEICRAALEREGLLAGERRITVLRKLAGFAGRIGRAEESREAAREGLEVAQSLGDDCMLARGLVDIVGTNALSGPVDENVATLRRALELLRGCDDPITEGRARGNLALFYNRLQRIEESRAEADAAERIFRDLGEDARVAAVLLGRATLERGQNRSEDAIRYLERAIRLAEQSDDTRVQSYAHGNLAMALCNVGRFRDAIVHLDAQLEAANRYGDFRAEMAAAGNRGNIELGLGNPGHALRYFRLAGDLAAVYGDPRAESTALVNVALVEKIFGQLEECDRTLTQAAGLVRRYELVDQEPCVLVERAHWIRQRGDIDGGIELCREAESKAMAVNQGRIAAGILLGMGCMEKAAERHDDARRTLEKGRALAAQVGDDRLALRYDLYLAETPAEVEAVHDRFDEVESSMEVVMRLEMRLGLFEKAGEVADLVEARRLLQKLRAQAPAGCRDSMVERSTMFIKIEKAWAELA